MYFFKNKGRQELDLKGNLILTNNVNLITARISSAAPSHVANAKYIKLQNAGFFRKLKATFKVIGFIWGKPEVLPTALKLMAVKNPEKLKIARNKNKLDHLTEPDNFNKEPKICGNCLTCNDPGFSFCGNCNQEL